MATNDPNGALEEILNILREKKVIGWSFSFRSFPS